MTLWFVPPLGQRRWFYWRGVLLILTGTEQLTNNWRFKQYSAAQVGQVVFHILKPFEHALDITCIKQRISAHQILLNTSRRFILHCKRKDNLSSDKHGTGNLQCGRILWSGRNVLLNTDNLCNCRKWLFSNYFVFIHIWGLRVTIKNNLYHLFEN